MKITNLSVNRPVGILMVVLIVILLGVVSLSRLAIDLLPELEVPIVMAITSYEGAGPQEVERIVTEPIESQLSTLSGVKSIRSRSSAGSSMVIVEFEWGTNLDYITNEMREKIDLISSFFPDSVSKPMIVKMDVDMMPIMMIGVTSDQDLEKLKKIIEDKIKPRLERIEGVASVDIIGGKTREIQVEVDPSKLQAYNLTINDIVQIIRAENNNTPGGYVQQGTKDYLVRVTGEYENVRELEKVLIPLKTGGTIELGHLANIKDTYKEETMYSFLNGEPAIAITIQKQSGANTVEVSDKILATLEQVKKEVPGNLFIKIAMDQAEFIRLSINQVVSNAWKGALLAIIILFLFLRSIRSTMIIGIAIPISIITTFTLVYFGGLTLNMMTLGGLALGIGMMVDSAIVILENIYRHRQEGSGRLEAAKFGTAEVGTAVIASTLTTIVVFLPIAYVRGLASQIFRPFALTISFSLLASLLVALSFVPMLASKFLIVENNGNGNPKNFMQRLSKKWADFLRLVDRKYRSLLNWALGHRKTVIIITTLAFIFSVALIPLIGTEFIPAQDSGYFSVEIRLPNSTVLEETARVTEQIEKMIAEFPEIDALFVNIGSGTMGTTNSHSASITGRLLPLSQRTRGVEEIMDEIRQKTANIPGAEISVSAEGGAMISGSPIDVTVKGPDLDQLKIISDQIMEIVENVPGTREVTSSLTEGSPELSVKLDREKANKYGVTAYQVAQAVQTGLQGATASQFRTGGDEIDIKVLLPEENRKTIDSLNRLMVTSALGFNVPLEEVAEIQYKTGPQSITRVDQSRIVSVVGDIFGRDLGSVMADIQREVSKVPLPAGYEIEFAGANQEMVEAFTDLALALVLAIILVYMILAIQFDALLTPFIIMFSIPPTLIGVVLGLLLTGRTFNVVTFIGVIMLAGIVVNNAIVLVDYINTLRERGLERREAVLRGGQTRLRPILMTTLTTVLALIPLTLGIGEGAELSSPMATAVVFGLSFSTLITLVLIPVMYTILDDLSRKFKKRFKKPVDGETAIEGM